jgi:hypothetical protein
VQVRVPVHEDREQHDRPQDHGCAAKPGLDMLAERRLAAGRFVPEGQRDVLDLDQVVVHRDQAEQRERQDGDVQGVLRDEAAGGARDRQQVGPAVVEGFVEVDGLEELGHVPGHGKSPARPNGGPPRSG